MKAPKADQYPSGLAMDPFNSLKALSLAAGVPISATIQVTDRCNYECIHCYQEHTKEDPLSTEDIRRLMAEMSALGVLYLTLMGGEFFMRRDADEILRMAHEMGFFITLKTTGHHLNERRAELIASLRPIEVHLSVYGVGAGTHDTVTRQAGSFERTMAAARRLHARDIALHFMCPAMEVNADELEALRGMASEMGAKLKIDASILAMETGELTPVALRLTEESLQRYEQRLARLSREAGLSEPLPLPDPAHSSCSAGKVGFAVTAKGRVWPCLSLPLDCGDAMATPLRDLWWGSGPLREVREVSWATMDECGQCPVRAYCHRCHAMAQVEHGNWRGPSLEACRQAVARREALRAEGLVADADRAMPPTWDRVAADGQHHQTTAQGVRTTRLRVLG